MHERREGKKVTCGVLVTDGTSFLMGDAYHYWDIPKGRPDPGEDHAHAAARELGEETGIVAAAGDLLGLGLYHYRHDTDLVLHLLHVERMPDLAGLACTSMVDDGRRPAFPEIRAFAIVPWASLEGHATANMTRCLRLAEPLVMEGIASGPPSPAP